MISSEFDKLIEEINTLRYKGEVNPRIYKSRAKILAMKYLPEQSFSDFEKEIDGTFGPTISSTHTPESFYRDHFNDSKKLLVGIIENMKFAYELLSKDNKYDSDKNKVKNLNDIFIVHGHDRELLLDTDRLMKRLDLNPIILQEEPDRGRTIIEKFEEYSDVDFAIILLSPEDRFYSCLKDPTQIITRSRQNVVLELGFFLGKLGRDHIIVLHKEDETFELPSDISGLIYQSYSRGWENDVADELIAFGFEINKNNI